MQNYYPSIILKAYNQLDITILLSITLRVKNIFFLLLIIPLSSCTDQELGWFIISPNNIEGLTNLKFLLSGLTTTIYISVVSIIISMFLGLIVAIPSLAKNKFLTYINIGYVEIVRAVPLLVLILWIYYGSVSYTHLTLPTKA